jgi:hypothetical protein
MREDRSVPLHIGIVACSAEGAALCYRTVCVEGAQFLGTHDHPEVSMHTHSLATYMECFNRGDWAGVGELMLSSAQKLSEIGANFLICPDNTIHQAMPHVERVRRCPGCTLRLSLPRAQWRLASGALASLALVRLSKAMSTRGSWQRAA